VKKETQNPQYEQEFSFSLLDGKIPVTSTGMPLFFFFFLLNFEYFISGAIEKIKVGVWNMERNIHQFIGGHFIGSLSSYIFLSFIISHQILQIHQLRM
jgi:hypothetical protein